MSDFSRVESPRTADVHRMDLTAVIWLFALAPLAAGFIFRSYFVWLRDPVLEVHRQLDMPHILIEVAVIMLAKARGLSLRQTFISLPRSSQVPLAGFVAIYWISSVFVSPEPVLSTIRASFWICHLCFGAAVWHLVRQSGTRDASGWFGPLTFGFCLSLAYCAFHILSAPSGRYYQWSGMMPGYLSVRHVGLLAGALFVMTLPMAWSRDRSMRSDAAQLGLMALLFGALSWSGTRAALAAIAVAGPMLLVLNRRMPHWRGMGIAALAVLVGTLATQPLLPAEAAFGLLNRGADISDANAFTSGRTAIWAATLSQWSHHMLLGSGEGSMLWLVELDGMQHVQPHNMVVQFLQGWGLLPSLLAFAILGLLMLRVCQAGAAHSAVQPMVALAWGILAMAMFDGAMYFSRFVTLFAIGTAAALAISRNRSDGEAIDRANADFRRLLPPASASPLPPPPGPSVPAR